MWSTDEYGIVTLGVVGGEGPRVVCNYHPEIPDEGFRGGESLNETTQEKLNDAL
ncbi:DUF7539 family protein [Halobium salinum]|uniref:DUF7539 family protein n=1 Tax=Halobium salinum TaxID=1364940 RepID=UPI003CCD5805